MSLGEIGGILFLAVVALVVLGLAVSAVPGDTTR